MTTYDVVSPSQTRVLLALVRVHSREHYASVRTVAREAGYKSTSTVHGLLMQLKAKGLADWEWGLAGTLRPTVVPVPAAL